MVSPLIGQTVAIGSALIPNFRNFFFQNLDSGEKLEGQYEAITPTENVSAKWKSTSSLNRQNSIKQFLHGEDDTLSFTARFFQDSVTGSPLLSANPVGLLGGGSPLGKLDKLKSWARIDESLRRPPILNFWIGDSHIQLTCVIINLADIAYGRPDFFGGFKDVSLTIDLEQFVPFSLDDEGETDTRYARARERDYYESLAFAEYNNPLLGDVIRKQHPQLQLLRPGDVVRLPSIEGVRNQRVTQTSLPLKTAFGRKDTPQKRLRQEFFDLRNRSKVSHILQPSTTPR